VWNGSRVLTLSLTASAMLLLPGAAQEKGSIRELLAGNALPLTLKLKDLTPGWRRLAVGGEADAGSSGGPLTSMMGAMFGMAGGASPAAAYYTEGDILTIRSETFLVTYRLQPRGMDVAGLMKMGQGGQPLASEKLSPDSALAVTLLNLRAVASLSDIRPFNMQQEIADAERAAAAEAALGQAIGGGIGGMRQGFPGAMPSSARPAPRTRSAPRAGPAPGRRAPKSRRGR
jgi:hypothetical protein